MTPAVLSVYRPYIMFFALVDKFHQLLKVSGSCFTERVSLLPFHLIVPTDSSCPGCQI